MTGARKLDPKLTAITEKLAEPLKQANLAYRFAPSSYTFECMSAIHAATNAQRTIEAWRDGFLITEILNWNEVPEGGAQ